MLRVLESQGVAMSLEEFFSYLLGRDTSRELTAQLVDIYRLRTRDVPTTAHSGRVRR
jgi:hypothetical protein